MEKEQLEAGQIPAEWRDNPQRLAQKDLDARWTQQRGQSHYGYKNHINVDGAYGLIRCYEVTDAAMHDSQVLGALLDAENGERQIDADSAYRSQERERVLGWMGFESQILERRYRNQKLSQEQKVENRAESRAES